MTNERINIEVVKPKYEIGQVIWVPQRDEPTDARIVRYNLEVGRVSNWSLEDLEQGKAEDYKGKLIGKLKSYEIDSGVLLRVGTDSELTFSVQRHDLYTDKQKAQEASKFLEVDVDTETWKLAIGDRKVKDEKSPYHVDNSGLPRCCTDISEARDLLLYCQRQKGLIVHDKNWLKELLDDHGHPTTFQKDSPIRIILEKLLIL